MSVLVVIAGLALAVAASTVLALVAAALLAVTGRVDARTVVTIALDGSPTTDAPAPRDRSAAPEDPAAPAGPARSPGGVSAVRSRLGGPAR